MTHGTRLRTAARAGLAGLALGLSGLGGLSLPANADMIAARVAINPAAPAFRAQHPIRVYLSVDIDTRLGRDDLQFERTAIDVFRRNLPPYVVLVASPFRSDLAITVDQRRYDLDFRNIRRDKVQEPYSPAAHWTAGPCHRFDMAYYTAVRKQGVATARYDLDIRMRHLGSRSDRLETRTKGGYDFARRLRASTNCGIIDTRHAPNRAVRDMLDRGTPDYNRIVAQGIRTNAAQDLGRALAARVRSLSDRYYAGLAYNVGLGVDVRIVGGYWRFQDDTWLRPWRRNHGHVDWYDDWRAWHHRHERTWTRNRGWEHEREEHEHDRDHDRGHGYGHDRGHDRGRDGDHDHPRRY